MSLTAHLLKSWLCINEVLKAESRQLVQSQPAQSCVVTEVSHKERLIMRRTSELSHDLCKLVALVTETSLNSAAVLGPSGEVIISP